jgi:hypothetical protein
MNKSTFNPEILDFRRHHPESFWSTDPRPDSNFGYYTLSYDADNDWWTLYETVKYNHGDRDIRLYSGRIPDDKWGFELFRNMEISVPVIQREINIDIITNDKKYKKTRSYF